MQPLWPDEWKGRPIDLFEVLRVVADEVTRGRPLWCFTGSSGPEGLAGFIDGWMLACGQQAQRLEFSAFIESARLEGRDLLNDLLSHSARLEVSAGKHDAVERFLEAVLEYSGTSYGSTQE